MSGFRDIWQKHRTGRRKGAYVELAPDLVFGHEATLSLILPQLERLGGPKIPAERLFFVADHFAPPSSGPHADILRAFRSFCRARGIELALFEGLGHRLMLESDRVPPGAFVVGADSHTTTIGGKGALGIGLGSTDVLAVLMTGTVWLKTPPVSCVTLQGSPPPFVETKDVVLHLLERFGQDGFLDQVIEFHEAGPAGFDVEQRAVLTNMSVEMGAVSALALGASAKPDPSGCGKAPEAGISSGGKGVVVSLPSLRSLVALPGCPDRVVPAASLKETAIDCAIVGSCAAGGLDDLAVAARLLQGRKVAGGVSLLVTPATRKVMLAADRAGILATLLEAGATLLNPSCGACGGIDKGIPAVGDNVISTAPRNYSSRTRMGANVFLASTATCVASAMAGRITAPQEAGA